MKLSEFYGTGKEFETHSPVNIDDIFRVVRKQNVTELEVTPDEMYVIALFAIANAQGLFDKDLSKNEVLEIIKTGKINMFFGVKLTQI